MFLLYCRFHYARNSVLNIFSLRIIQLFVFSFCWYRTSYLTIFLSLLLSALLHFYYIIWIKNKYSLLKKKTIKASSSLSICKVLVFKLYLSLSLICPTFSSIFFQLALRIIVLVCLSCLLFSSSFRTTGSSTQHFEKLQKGQ